MLLLQYNFPHGINKVLYIHLSIHLSIYVLLRMEGDLAGWQLHEFGISRINLVPQFILTSTKCR